MTTKKPCFIISPIGEEASDIRKRADQIFKHVLLPAAQACGYEPIRADQISEPGLITSQVIQHIVDDPLVIADLTGMNPNVFYELAIRHAIRRPLVQIIQKGDKIPFDLAGMRTIPVDHRDLDCVEDAKLEIQKQIKAVEGKKPDQIESPISVSVEIQTLRQSDRAEDRSLGEFVSALSSIRSEIASLEKRLSDPQNIVPASYLRDVLRSSSGVGDRRVMKLAIGEVQAVLHRLRSEMGKRDSNFSKQLLTEFESRLERLILDIERSMID